MSTFAGTTQKCKACEKTVYWVEQLTADNVVYHKTCFRCHHCKGTVKLCNYSSLEGVLYRKPHFDQLFKMTGRLEKSFEADQATNTRISGFFSGTQEKCAACKKTEYLIEKMTELLVISRVSGVATVGLLDQPSNYITDEHHHYCKHHRNQLLKVKGNFSQLDKNARVEEEVAKVEELKTCEPAAAA